MKIQLLVHHVPLVVGWLFPAFSFCSEHGRTRKSSPLAFYWSDCVYFTRKIISWKLFWMQIPLWSTLEFVMYLWGTVERKSYSYTIKKFCFIKRCYSMFNILTAQQRKPAGERILGPITKNVEFRIHRYHTKCQDDTLREYNTSIEVVSTLFL